MTLGLRRTRSDHGAARDSAGAAPRPFPPRHSLGPRPIRFSYDVEPTRFAAGAFAHPDRRRCWTAKHHLQMAWRAVAGISVRTGRYSAALTAISIAATAVELLVEQVNRALDRADQPGQRPEKEAA